MRQITFELTKDASRSAGDYRVVTVTHDGVDARIGRRTRGQRRERTGGARPAKHAFDGRAERRGDRAAAAALVGEGQRDEETGERHQVRLQQQQWRVAVLVELVVVGAAAVGEQQADAEPQKAHLHPRAQHVQEVQHDLEHVTAAAAEQRAAAAASGHRQEAGSQEVEDGRHEHPRDEVDAPVAAKGHHEEVVRDRLDDEDGR